MSNITVNSQFDAGSIEIVDIANPSLLKFKIRKDTNSHFAQWFYFQINNVKGCKLKLNFIDLKHSAYPQGWINYNICVSYDNQSWFRVPTTFDGDTLECNFTPLANTVYFAYFEPYSYSRHLKLIGKANLSTLVKHEVLGTTYEGRNLDLLIVGNQQALHKIWIIARQHPGETMAEWFMEGLIHKLLDQQDAVSKALLKNCVFYLVPNMNPDGACHGNLRVNALGVNLNREWLTPSLTKSPEVFMVKNKMQAVGVNMFLDIHGDEAIPYVFTSGCEENPSFTKQQGQLFELFKTYFKMVNPDYQTQIGYEKGHFTTEQAMIASNWVGTEFGCLSFILEMPFKDNENLPDITYGWNGHRSYLLGQSVLTTINMVLNTP